MFATMEEQLSRTVPTKTSCFEAAIVACFEAGFLAHKFPLVRWFAQFIHLMYHKLVAVARHATLDGHIVHITTDTPMMLIMSSLRQSPWV